MSAPWDRPTEPEPHELMDAREAIRRTARSRIDSFPSALDRLAPIALPEIRPGFRFPRRAMVFTAGSCFARNMETELDRCGFKVPAVAIKEPGKTGAHFASILNKNTAAGILQELAWARRVLARDGLVTQQAFSEAFLENPDGTVIDTFITHKSHERGFAEARRRYLFEVYRHAFEADIVILTFGMVENWWDAERRQYLRRMPTRAMLRERGHYRFVRHGFDATRSQIESVVALIRAENPASRFLISVSPVPLLRTFSGDDVLVANLYGKSVLRAACGEIAAMTPDVDYFPSYETVMLSPASEAYLADRRHVHPSLVRLIVERAVRHYAPMESAFTATAELDLGLE